MSKKKIMTIDIDGQNSSHLKTSSAKKGVYITKGLLIVVIALISVLAVGAGTIIIH